MKYSKFTSKLARYIIKPWLILSLFLGCLYIKYTYPKATFIMQLFHLTELSHYKTTQYETLLGRAYSQNHRIQPLVNFNQNKDQALLVAFAEECIRNHKIKLIRTEKKYQKIVSIVADKFPDNLYLDCFCFYPPQEYLHTWENFDPLFLTMVKSPKNNSLSAQILTEAIFENKISSPVLYNLLHYLTWENNLEIFKNLLRECGKNQILDERQRQDLLSEMHRARATSSSPEVAKPRLKQIRHILKANFGVSLNKLRLGKNMISDGGFKQNDTLSGFWEFADWSNEALMNKGSYTGGLDSKAGHSMRIMGFYTEKSNDRVPSRAGYWYQNWLELKDKFYLVYFAYKTQTGNEHPSFWLSESTQIEQRFEPTKKTWKEVYLIINNEDMNLKNIRPLFRMWGTGTVWFDNIYISEIEILGLSIEK